MFDAKPSIIYLTKTKIFLLDPLQSAPAAQEAWDGVTMTDALTRLKNSHGFSRVHILLGNDISYTVAFTAPTNELSREHVLERTQELIPEELTTTTFDWKEVAGSAQKGVSTVQVIAMPVSYLNALSLAMKKIECRAETIAPIGPYLASFTQQENKPHLVIWNGPELICTVAHGGAAFFSERLDTDNVHLAHLVEFIRRTFSEEGLFVFIDDSLTNPPPLPANAQAGKREIRPLGLIMQQPSGKGADRTFLSIPLLEIPADPKKATKPVTATETATQSQTTATNPQASPTTPSQAKKSHSSLIKYVLLLVVILGALAVIVWYAVPSLAPINLF